MKTWVDALIEQLEATDIPHSGDVATFAVAVAGWAIYFVLVIWILP